MVFWVHPTQVHYYERGLLYFKSFFFFLSFFCFENTVICRRENHVFWNVYCKVTNHEINLSLFFVNAEEEHIHLSTLFF